MMHFEWETNKHSFLFYRQKNGLSCLYCFLGNKFQSHISRQCFYTKIFFQNQFCFNEQLKFTPRSRYQWLTLASTSVKWDIFHHIQWHGVASDNTQTTSTYILYCHRPEIVLCITLQKRSEAHRWFASFAVVWQWSEVKSELQIESYFFRLFIWRRNIPAKWLLLRR